MEIPPLYEPPQNKLKDFLLSNSTAGWLAPAAEVLFLYHITQNHCVSLQRGVLGSRMKGSEAAAEELFLKRHGFSRAAQSKGGLLADGMLSAIN